MAEITKRSGEMARAAWLYYAESLTQGQIAERLGVSRSTVIRLIQKAKDSGIVQITIGAPSETFELERDFENRFGLRKVRLVPEAMDGEMQRRWLGQAAAELLIELVSNNSILAVSWGSTLQAMADALNGEVTHRELQVVGLNGGLHKASRGTNPHEVAEQVGEFFGASARSLYAPVYVREEVTADSLYRDPGVREVLDLARSAALVVFSFGGVEDDATMLKLGYVNAQEQAFLVKQGAVGEIAGRWINAKGKQVTFPPTIHPIGITIDDVRRIPSRLAVAGGEDKLGAMRAGLEGGLITHLVTDEKAAAALLQG